MLFEEVKLPDGSEDQANGIQPLGGGCGFGCSPGVGCGINCNGWQGNWCGLGCTK